MRLEFSDSTPLLGPLSVVLALNGFLEGPDTCLPTAAGADQALITLPSSWIARFRSRILPPRIASQRARTP